MSYHATGDVTAPVYTPVTTMRATIPSLTIAPQLPAPDQTLPPAAPTSNMRAWLLGGAALVGAGIGGFFLYKKFRKPVAASSAS